MVFPPMKSSDEHIHGPGAAQGVLQTLITNHPRVKARRAVDIGSGKPSSLIHTLIPGAAPGGWTAHLATVAERVIAVDPAALAPEVAALPNVTHLRKQSAAALDDIRRLAPGGADLLVRPSSFAAVVVEFLFVTACDMVPGPATCRGTGYTKRRSSLSAAAARVLLAQAVLLLSCLAVHCWARAELVCHHASSHVSRQWTHTEPSLPRRCAT